MMANVAATNVRGPPLLVQSKSPCSLNINICIGPIADRAFTYNLASLQASCRNTSPVIFVVFWCCYTFRRWSVRNLTRLVPQNFDEQWALWGRKLWKTFSQASLCFFWVAILRVIKLNILASCIISIQILL